MRKLSLKTQRKLLLCPRCGKTMDKWKHHGVIIDVCPKCEGMWVDKGELDTIFKKVKLANKKRKKKIIHWKKRWGNKAKGNGRMENR